MSSITIIGAMETAPTEVDPTVKSKDTRRQSGVKGVFWHGPKGCWTANCYMNGKRHQQYFRHEEDTEEAIEKARLLAVDHRHQHESMHSNIVQKETPANVTKASRVKYTWTTTSMELMSTAVLALFDQPKGGEEVPAAIIAKLKEAGLWESMLTDGWIHEACVCKEAVGMWTCPVPGCGHTMKKNGTAGSRSHIRRRHKELTLQPCPKNCQHGCATCVPERTYLHGLPAKRPVEGGSSASAASDTKAKAQPSKTQLDDTFITTVSPPGASMEGSIDARSAGTGSTVVSPTKRRGRKRNLLRTAIIKKRRRVKEGYVCSELPANTSDGTSHVRKRSNLGQRLGRTKMRRSAVNVALHGSFRADLYGIESLPDDVPADHESRKHIRIRTCSGGFSGRASCRFTFSGEFMQITSRMSGGNVKLAAYIARACYAKFMEGFSKADVIKFRSDLVLKAQSGISIVAEHADQADAQPENEQVHHHVCKAQSGISIVAEHAEQADAQPENEQVLCAITHANSSCEACARAGCQYRAHSTQGTGYCCNKCKAGTGHGKLCEKCRVEVVPRCRNDSLRQGARVIIRGLVSDTKFNGKFATCLLYDTNSLRWRIRLDNGVEKTLRSERLHLVGEHQQCTPCQLYALLRQGADIEVALRGVEASCQAELLDLINAGVQRPAVEACQTLEVPLGVTNLWETSNSSSVGALDAWTQVALCRGIPYPVDCHPSALTRLGSGDGLGPADDFSLGVIVGPSGSGVTRLLLRLANDLNLPKAPHACFRSDQAIASNFEDAVSTLPMVGLNSVPAWMRPYHVLSNGQQQRVRLGMYMRSFAVIDDFGSGIGKQELRSVANAIGKFIRKEKLKHVLIGTHCPDAVKFLQPDFVMCATGCWSVNPNPPDQQRATVRLEPKAMGQLAEPHESQDAEAFHYMAAETYPGAVKVKRTKLQVNVQLDQRTLDAANAFEFDFEGNATCEVPVLPYSRLPSSWILGLVVGPSGTGKTTTIRNFCAAHDLQVEDSEAPVDDVTVFSSVASACDSADIAAEVLEVCQLPQTLWLSKVSCLSRSEAWRAHLARRVAGCHAKRWEPSDKVVVVDEFTTQLDRSRARSLCEALSGYVHRTGIRLLCATVHDDIIPWVHPCWILDTARAEFAALERDVTTQLHEGEEEEEKDQPTDISDPTDAFLWDPPVVHLDVEQVSATSSKGLWKQQFSEHHYLTGKLGGRSDGYFVVKERHSGSFVAFHAVSMLPGATTFIREHRLVVRPEWQGFGIGPRLSSLMASRWLRFSSEQGYSYSSKTAHPRLGELRQHDPSWQPTCTNLRSSDGRKFGDIGAFVCDAARPRFPHFVLPWGTRVGLKRVKDGCRVILGVPKMDLKLNIEIPQTGDTSIEEILGLTFHGEARNTNLNISRIDGAHIEHSMGDKPEGLGWRIESINGQLVSSRAEVTQLLHSWAHVHSMTLCYTYQRGLRTPARSCQSEAQADFEWIRARCLAQVGLQAEINAVAKLCKELQKWASKGHSGYPNIPEVPLEVMPELRSAAVTCKPVPKNRICYSHAYVGDQSAGIQSTKRWGDNEKYQHLMLMRVPELRAEGKTHQAAIETAMSEWQTHRVAKFAWSDVSDTTIDLECDTCSILGLVVDRTCKILQVIDHDLAFQRGCSQAAQPAECIFGITAIRRGTRKINNIKSVGDLSEGLKTLQGFDGSDFWLYFERERSPYNNVKRLRCEEPEEEAADEDEEEEAGEEEEGDEADLDL